MGFHPSVRISLSVLGFIFAFFLYLLILPIPQQASTQKQTSSQTNKVTPAWFNRQQANERKRRIIFKHNIPQEVKIDIRNLQNDNWPKDLEVEIKNVSNKPIYYIYLPLIMDEVNIAGFPASFILEFGDNRFKNKLDLSQSSDMLIKPGESYTLKIPKNQIENVEKKIADLGIEFKVTKIEFNLNIINFGDGTGYFGGKPDFSKKKKSPVTSLLPLPRNTSVSSLALRAIPSLQQINSIEPLFGTLMSNVEKKTLNSWPTLLVTNPYNVDDQCKYYATYETSCPLIGGGSCPFTGAMFISDTDPSYPGSVYLRSGAK